MKTILVLLLALQAGAALAQGQAAGGGAASPKTIEVPFTSHDGLAMFGKLTLPQSPGLHPAVVYVQTAEAATVDMKRRLGPAKTFNYFDLYRSELPKMNVAFFSYEGRGVRMGDEPPRYEQIDPEIYKTSTLENKVRDVLSAVETAGKQPGVDPGRIFLMGSSEGTLLAAEAAAREPIRIAGLILYAVLPDTMRSNFRYIMTDGGFLAYRGFFDTDRDGKISKAEFEADPKQYRARVFHNAPFEAFDRNGDGFFTVDEMSLLTKPYLDAIANEDYAVLDNWAKTAAGVATPPGWFKDHFHHEPIWTFLSKLDMPVGIFHGTEDTNAPVGGVRKIEALAKASGKSRFKFHYIDGADHSLGIIGYFADGTLPEGHRAIFDYIKKTATKGGS